MRNSRYIEESLVFSIIVHHHNGLYSFRFHAPAFGECFNVGMPDDIFESLSASTQKAIDEWKNYLEKIR